MTVTDAELAERVRFGRDDVAFTELAARYDRVIGANVRGWTVPGASVDDLKQVALMALWKACLGFDRDRGPLPARVKVCIHGELANFSRAQETRGRQALSEAHSLDAPPPRSMWKETWRYESTGRLGDRLPSTYSRDPFDVVAAIEQLFAFKHAGLTRLEHDSVVCAMTGNPPTNELAAKRARRRARQRIRAYLGETATVTQWTNTPVDPEVRERAVTLVGEGYSFKRAAEATGVSAMSVHNWCRQAVAA